MPPVIRAGVAPPAIQQAPVLASATTAPAGQVQEELLFSTEQRLPRRSLASCDSKVFRFTPYDPNLWNKCYTRSGIPVYVCLGRESFIDDV